MTPQKLKNSILQRAIQGKLVEQRPEEGTGEELYRQIQAEKKRLIKEGKIKKEKPLPEIAEDEKSFDIPESWKWVRIGELTYNWGQKTPDSRFCYIDVGSINNTSHTLNKENTVVEAKDASSRAKKIVKKGDVIFATIRPYLKNICIIDIDFPCEPIASTAFAVMHCPEGLLNKYLYYYLLSPTFMRFANARDKAKGVAYPAIGEKDFFNGIIALPPVAEQKRIVAQIEELLPYIDRYADSYERLEQVNTEFPEDMKKSVLQYAIQGKLVEQRAEEGTGEELYQQIQTEKKRLIKEGKIKKEKPLPEIAEDEIPFDIPESWRWVRFSEIMSTMSTGPFGSMLHKTDYIEKGIPLVNPANMVNGKIVPSDKMMISEATRRRLSSYILHAGMIVLGRRGEMGRCAVVTEKEDGWLCGTGSFFMEPSMSLYVYYVVSLFSSPYVKFYLGGESVGTTMSNLNHTILSKMPIPLPPLAEQRRIVAKLDEILPLCERLK